jgi:tetratricopeptide (TPR) repeat protein
MEPDTIIKRIEPSTGKAQCRPGREDMVNKAQRIIATVTIVVQENPQGQGDEWPTRAPALSAGNPSAPSSTSGSSRSVSAKPWFLSVFIILVAVAFSGYSWLDALARFRGDDEGKTFVRRAIANAPVSLPTPKVSQQTLNTMASEAPSYKMAREQPKGASPNHTTEQEKKAPQASPDPNPRPLKKTTLFSQALALHKDGRLQEAKKMYEAALERSPNLVSALNNLGTIHIEEKDYAQAHRVLEKATLADPTYADPYYNLACLNALQTNVAQSLFYLKKAIAADHTVRDRAKGDLDFANIRGHVEYEKMVNGVKKS